MLVVANLAKKIDFHKTPMGGGHRFMKLFCKIEFFFLFIFGAFLVQADRMGGQQCPTGTQYPPATRNFYQTQVYLGSDLWVLMSLRE